MKQLLSVVEDKARSIRCHIAYLILYDFQAKDFYLKMDMKFSVYWRTALKGIGYIIYPKNYER